MRRASLFVLGLLITGITQPVIARSPQVALVTFGPGRLYWERFGHNAIVVNEPGTGKATAYNYGVFDFEQKNFFLNFARGRMRYQLVAEPLNADLAMYAAEARSVTVQVLSLTPAQAERLAQFLAWNARPENADYVYDYFTNNCSTKLRDALNAALGGMLERQLTRLPAPHTYRFDAVRLISPALWLAIGMDAALGPSADRPLNLWQESFAPEVLGHALRQVVVRDANGETRPLVSAEEVVLASALPTAPAAPPDLGLPFLLAGLALAGLLLCLARGRRSSHRVCFALMAAASWMICGFSGLALAALWGLTDHWAARGDENLLLLNPLCLVVPVLWWRAPRIARWLVTLIALTALASLVVRALPGLYQRNLPFIALTVPVHMSVAVLAWRQRMAAGHAM